MGRRRRRGSGYTGSFSSRRPLSFGRPLRLEPLEERRMLAITVDTLSDVVDAGDGQTSLREAIAAANTAPGADTIDFALALTAAGHVTLPVALGELAISESLTIDGPGRDLLTIDAQLKSRIFNFTAASGALNIEGLTLFRGKAPGDGGAIRSASQTASISVSQSTISGNSAIGSGGGIFSTGSLAVVESTISGNSALTGSGVSIAGRTVSVSDSTVGGEISATISIALVDTMLTEGGVRGGNDCSVTLDGSNVVDGVTTGAAVNVANSIVSGGASASQNTVTLTDSTITDGGIYANGGASLVRSTVAGDVRSQYGNVDLNDSTVIAGDVSTEYFYPDFPSPSVTLNNSSIIGGGIDSKKNVTLNHSSISGGSVQFYSGTATLNSSTITGGGVFMGSTQWRHGGNIVLENSRISGSSGNAISSHGNISIRSSTISGNAGIAIVFTNVLFTDFNSPPHSISVINSIIENNGLGGILSAPYSASLYPSPAASVDLVYSVVSGNGGRGITGEQVQLVNSTVSGNTTTGNGGGILSSIVTLVNSTVSGNSATGNGGGIWSDKIVRNSPAGPPYTNTYLGAVRLEYSTITNNQAGVGGGIWQDEGEVEIKGSIVAGNRASSNNPDLRLDSGPVTIVNSLIGDKAGTPLQESHVFDANGNLIGDSGGAGVIDPKLGPLRYNGGPTPTHALLPGSPAIDAIPYVLPPNAGDTAVHVYELDGSLVDAEGGPSLVSLGGTLTPMGYEFESNQGLNLSMAEIDPATYSIELVFSWDVLAGGWQKIIDFHNLTRDEGLYTASNGLHFLNTAFVDNLFSPNEERHLVLTRDDATKTVRAFVDGALTWSFVDSQEFAVLSGPDHVLRFFQDDQVTEQTEAGSGFVNRIRVFDRALSAAEVLELFDPPRPNLPANDQRGGPFDRVVNGDGQNGLQVDMGAFEFQPNPLAGDYNFNGIVDAADYSVWRDTVGSTTDLRADGSSATMPGVPEGVVDEHDYQWWKANFGNVIAQGAGSLEQGGGAVGEGYELQATEEIGTAGRASSGTQTLAGELRLAGVGEAAENASDDLVVATLELGSGTVPAGPARRSSPAVGTSRGGRTVGIDAALVAWLVRRGGGGLDDGDAGVGVDDRSADDDGGTESVDEAFAVLGERL